MAIWAKFRIEKWEKFEAQSLLGQKKYAEAEPLLLKGSEGLKLWKYALQPHEAPRLAEAAERLVQRYEAMDRQDEAAKWRKELEALKRK